MAEQKFDWKTYTVQVTIHVPERAKYLLEWFGTATIPVKSPYPQQSSSGRLFYEMDTNIITPEIKEKMISGMAKKFGYSEEFVRDNFFEKIHAIETTGTSLIVTGPMAFELTYDDRSPRFEPIYDDDESIENGSYYDE